MLVLRCLLLSVLVLFASSCSIISSRNLQEGISCFKAQDYRQAFIRLKPEADRENPEAQYAIGYMYYYGVGVTEDKQKALAWIKCAAHAGHPEAITALKIMSKTYK